VPANALLRPQRPFGALRPIADFKDPAQLGLETFANLSFRERLSADTCIHAGRCQDQCPAYVSGKPLNPKALIVNLQGLAAQARDGQVAEAEAAPLTERALSEEGVWACTTCGACNFHCPVLVEPMDAIAGMRRNLVLAKGKVPPTAQAALLNIQKRGHPWAGTKLTRTDWMDGLDVPLLADLPALLPHAAKRVPDAGRRPGGGASHRVPGRASGARQAPAGAGRGADDHLP
jgi:Fe-S oxidoreductase